MDVRVLFQLVIPLAVACGVVQAAFWLRWRTPALLWWAAADWVGTLGAALLLGRNLLPTWISQTLANTLIFCGGLLVWLGFRRCAGLSLPLRGFAVAGLLFLLVFEALHALIPDLAVWIVFASFALGLMNAGTALDLARAWPGERLPLRVFLVWVFALHWLFYLFRCVTAVTVEAGAEFLYTVGVQSATLLLGLFKVLLWNAAALSLVAARRREGVTAAA